MIDLADFRQHFISVSDNIIAGFDAWMTFGKMTLVTMGNFGGQFVIEGIISHQI